MDIHQLVYYLNVFFFIYMFAYAVSFFMLTFFASLNLDDFFIRKEHMSYVSLSNDDNYIPISILIPAYNEELTIIDGINSLLNLDYPEYEILIINDGSTDNTSQTIIENFNLKKIVRPIRKVVSSKEEIDIYENELNDGGTRIVLVNKENAGKADALNMGINASRYPLFICMDADSVLERDSLRMIVEPFLVSDDTIAVGGNIKVSNSAILDQGKIVEVKTPNKLLVIFQMIEYLRVFLTSRVSFNGINGNLIISGAFGLYSKKAVINVGGYTCGSIGEDMEIVVKMHAFYRKNKLKYKLGYVPDAVCWTQVPESIKVLMRQRRRWHIGMGQSLNSHKFMLLNPKYGAVGTVAYPYFYIFEYFAPLIELLGIFTIVISFYLNIINTQFLVIYLLVYIAFNIVLSSISVLLEKYMFPNSFSNKTALKLLFFCILESFGYRQLCSFFRVTALFTRNKTQWGEMTRVRNNTVEEAS